MKLDIQDKKEDLVFQNIHLKTIKSIGFLENLHNKNLLFFSEEHITGKGSDLRSLIIGELKVRLLESKYTKDLIKDSLQKDPSAIITESLENIFNSYNKLNKGAITFLNELVNYLVATKDNDNAPATFEGLAIERVPFLYKNGSRADHYYYNEQKVRVCTSNFPIPMNSELMTVLAHEFTHAVDDICFNLISVESFLCFLVKNTKNTNVRSVIQVAAQILDKELDSLYLGQLFKDIDRFKIKTKCDNDYDFFNLWYKEGVTNTFYDDKNNLLNFLQDKDGIVCYSAVPAEFLAFYVEKLFYACISKDFITSLGQWFNANIITVNKHLKCYIKEGITFIEFIATAFQQKIIAKDSIIKHYINASIEVLKSLKKEELVENSNIKIDFNQLNNSLNNLGGMLEDKKEDTIKTLELGISISHFNYTDPNVINIGESSYHDDC